MANMAFTVLETVGNSGLMLVAHTNKQPSDPEWDRYFTELVRHDPERMKSLVFTDGGALNSAQRKQVNDFLRGRTSICAVVTANAVVRGVVTALGWFNPKIRAYGPEQVEEALHYLQVGRDELVLVKREIQLLRKKLGYDDLRSIVAIAS